MPGFSDKNSVRARPASRPADLVPSDRGGRPGGSAFLLLLCLLLAGALPAEARSKRAPKVPAEPTPLKVIGAFDSLLEAGNLPAARALCTGQVLRMFDFLAMAQSRMSGLVDSARSREDTLADTTSGDWAYVKLSSHVVFKQPFLGQEELRSVQAVHLWHSPRGWLVAEFQELEGPQAPVRFRTGRPPADPPPLPDNNVRATVGVDSGPYRPLVDLADRRQDPDPAMAVPGPDAGRPDIFPISLRAPAKAGEANRLRYRIRLRSGRPLAGFLALDSYQTLVKAGDSSDWVMENRMPGPKDLASSKFAKAAKAARKAKSAAGRSAAAAAPGAMPPDSLAPYLASNAFLILEDSLLLAAARQAAGPSPDPARKAASIRKWVTDGFRFQLGARLFGTSSSVLRDMTGDCSEAAILTAALLRASGVPSRVALGFASAGRGVFIGHAWTEAWLGPRAGWVGVDAALGQFPAGVERVKLLSLDGRADMRIAATNLMLEALYNIDISITGAWKGKKALPLVAHPGAQDEGAQFFAEILKGIGEKPRPAAD